MRPSIGRGDDRLLCAAGDERDEDQAGDRGLVDEQVAAAQDHGDRHREHDHEPDLQRAGSDDAQQDVGRRQAEDDAGGQLDGAPAALPVGRAEADDRAIDANVGRGSSSGTSCAM